MTEKYYDNLPPVSDFIERYQLNAKKSLGQNFILDLNLTDKIASTIPNIENSVVMEVGSGPAGLTRALLARNAKKVIAIEFDSRAIGILREIQQSYPDRLVIIEDNALNIKIDDLYNQYAKPYGFGFAICSNLPYNISIPLTIFWLHSAEHIDSMTLMYQYEVGARITATPKTKDYGRISIISQIACKTKILFKVPRTCFTPAPKVTSCIVQFIPQHPQPSPMSMSTLEEVVKQAFSERRKMIRTTLKPLFSNQSEMSQILASLNIPETARAEQLSPQTFFELAETLLKR